MQPFKEQLLPIADFRARQGSSKLYPTAWLVFVGLLLLVPLLALSASAADFYVSPAGTTSTAPGTGTITSPWSLQTALSQPAAVHSGDTIWLRGGRYAGVFTSYLTGTAVAPIKVRQYPGERATLDSGTVTPNVSSESGMYGLAVNGTYTWYAGEHGIGTRVVERDPMWAVRNQTEEFVELALFYGIEFVAVLTLDFDLALDKNAFEKKFPTPRAAIFFESDTHTSVTLRQ